MPKLEANNLKFHYVRSGHGPDVVLVHGLGGNLAGWHLSIVPELQQDYRVLTYDLRGHGRSDAPSAGYTTGDMAHDLLGILDSLEIERPTIVGHSWGGDVVLHFALLHPERVSELVIIEGALLAPLASVYRSADWGGWPYAIGTIENLLRRPIPEEHRYDLEYLLRQLIEIPIQYGPAQGRPRDEEMILRVIDVLRPMWAGREADGNMGVESLSKIDIPTMLIYESNSVFREAHRALSERLPASTSAILPDGQLKHFTSLEHPELILSAMKKFLSSRCAALSEQPPRQSGRAAVGAGQELAPGEPDLGTATSIVEVLRRRAAVHPERPYLTWLADGEHVEAELTFGEMAARVDAVATSLVASGVKAGERALLLYPQGPDFLVAFLACLSAGVVAVPAYPPRNERHMPRIERILTDAGARVILSVESARSRVEGWLDGRPGSPATFLATDTIGAPGRHSAAPCWWPDTAPDDIAFLQYTSGSTGAPKGVVITHANILVNMRMIRETFDTDETFHTVSWLPAYHDMGLIGNLLHPLFIGARAILMSPAAFLQKPVRWLQAVSTFKARATGAPNFAFDLTARAVTAEQKRALDLSVLDLMYSGSEPIAAAALDRFAEAFEPCGFRAAAFYPCYGMAETTLLVAAGRRGEGARTLVVNGDALARHEVSLAAEAKDGRTLVGCGWSVRNQELAIVEPDSRFQITDGRVGEIWVRGPHVARGYWCNEDLSRETFGARLADGRGPFLRTGDLGFTRNDELFVTGRLKELIIIRGRNYYPQDIERVASESHPALARGSAAAFGVERDGEERLVVVQEVQRTALRDLDADAVRDAMVAAVADEFDVRVSEVVLIRPLNLPKTSSGKIQRSACRDRWLNRELDVVFSWSADRGAVIELPQAFADETVRNAGVIVDWMSRAIAAEIGSDITAIDPHAAFSSYGLDSVAVVRLSGALSEWLCRDLPPMLMYDFPTIDALAASLAGGLTRVDSGPEEVVTQLPRGRGQLLDAATANPLLVSVLSSKDQGRP